MMNAKGDSLRAWRRFADLVLFSGSRYLACVAGGTIFLMMFLVGVDVIGRYALRHPLKGSIDIQEMMLVLIAFLGMAYTQSKKGHVRIEVVFSLLPKRWQVRFDALTSLLTAVILGLMSWNLFAKVWSITVSPETGPRTDLLFIPHAPLIFLAGVGCLQTCLVSLGAVAQEVFKTWSANTDNSDQLNNSEN